MGMGGYHERGVVLGGFKEMNRAVVRIHTWGRRSPGRGPLSRVLYQVLE
jgi:hypothetical protein